VKTTTWILIAAVLVILAGCAGLTGNAKMTPATAQANRTSEPVRIETKSDAGTLTIKLPKETPATKTPAAPVVALSIPWQGGYVSLPAVPGMEVTVQGPSKQAVAAEKIAEASAGTGNGVSGNLKGLNIKDIKAPTVALSEHGPSAGGGGMKGLALIGKSTAAYLFYGLGALLLVAGIVVFLWLKQTGLGVALALAGVAVVATGVLIATYPWVFLLPIVLLVAGGVWFIFYAKSHGGMLASLQAIVTGVEKAPADASAAVKASIASSGGLSVKSVITAIKNKLGLRTSDAPAASAPAAPPAVPPAAPNSLNT
jgi:hypothetical protein